MQPLQLFLLFSAVMACIGFQPKFQHAQPVQQLIFNRQSSPLVKKSLPLTHIGSLSRLAMISDVEVESAEPKANKLWDAYLKTTDTLTTLFPLWTVLFAGLALYKPSTFAWFTTKYFTAFLGT
jgi:hypothetical protein